MSEKLAADFVQLYFEVYGENCVNMVNEEIKKTTKEFTPFTIETLCEALGFNYSKKTVDLGQCEFKYIRSMNPICPNKAEGVSQDGCKYCKKHLTYAPKSPKNLVVFKSETPQNQQQQIYPLQNYPPQQQQNLQLGQHQLMQQNQTLASTEKTQ